MATIDDAAFRKLIAVEWPKEYGQLLATVEVPKDITHKQSTVIWLVPSEGNTFRELGTEVTWVRDQYTEAPVPFTCAACDAEIPDEPFWTCLDGGDAAHTKCVTIFTSEETQ